VVKRSKSAVAVAVATAMSVVMAVPALADDGVGEFLEDKAERVEEFYDDHGYDADIDVDDVYYGPFAYPFYGWGLYGADVDEDDGEWEIGLD
jgi:hypothetical protein